MESGDMERVKNLMERRGPGKTTILNNGTIVGHVPIDQLTEAERNAIGLPVALKEERVNDVEGGGFVIFPKKK